MEEIDEKKLSKEVIDEVERKIKTLDLIKNYQEAIYDGSEDWKPLGDCPFFGKLKSIYILDCYRKNKNNKKIGCEILNNACLCKIARKSKIPMKGDK